MSEHVEDFEKQISEVLETFKIQNAKYGESWIKDPFDARILLAEINAKHFRLKNLIWDEWDKCSDEAHRARAVETINDTILYMLMLSRRLRLEKGEVDQVLIRKMVDKT